MSALKNYVLPQKFSILHTKTAFSTKELMSISVIRNFMNAPGIFGLEAIFLEIHKKHLKKSGLNRSALATLFVWANSRCRFSFRRYMVNIGAQNCG